MHYGGAHLGDFFIGIPVMKAIFLSGSGGIPVLMKIQMNDGDFFIWIRGAPVLMKILINDRSFLLGFRRHSSGFGKFY